MICDALRIQHPFFREILRVLQNVPLLPTLQGLPVWQLQLLEQKIQGYLLQPGELDYHFIDFLYFFFS
jgi:hypothetical protein